MNQLDGQSATGTVFGSVSAVILNGYVDIVATAALGAVVGFAVTELLKWLKKVITNKNKDGK